MWRLGGRRAIIGGTLRGRLRREREEVRGVVLEGDQGV